MTIYQEQPKKRDATSAVIALLLVLGAVGMAAYELSDSPLLPQDTAAPAFELSRLEGGTVKLEELRGKVVVLDFWATWCPPCNEEMPYLLKISREYEAKGVVFVAVSHDEPAEAREVVTEYCQRFPALRAHAVFGNPEVGAAYLVRALPTLYVLDRQGKVVASRQGLASERYVRAKVEEALARP